MDERGVAAGIFKPSPIKSGMRALVVEPCAPRPPVPPNALFNPCAPPAPPKPVAVRPAPAAPPVVVPRDVVVEVAYLDCPCALRKRTPAPTGPAPVVAFMVIVSPSKSGLPVPKTFTTPTRPIPTSRRFLARSPETFITRSRVSEIADSSVLSVTFASLVWVPVLVPPVPPLPVPPLPVPPPPVPPPPVPPPPVSPPPPPCCATALPEASAVITITPSRQRIIQWHFMRILPKASRRAYLRSSSLAIANPSRPGSRRRLLPVLPGL